MAARYIFSIVILLAGFKSFAQEDCEITLNRAFEEYSAGHFYIIPSILEPCLNNFSPEQQQRAHLLLAETYLLLHDSPSAKNSFMNVLRVNPAFEADTSLHPIDLVYLSKKFTASPIFSLSVKGGANTSVIRLIHEQSTIGEPSSKSTYQLRMGYHVGVGADYGFNDFLTTRVEAIYVVTSYQQSNKNFFNQDTKVLLARQNWLMVPFTVHYNDTRGKYRPYGYMGYQFQYLFSEKGNVTITNNRPSSADGQQRERTPEESPEIDFLSKRRRFNQSLVFGGGVKIKVGLDFVFIDVRYTAGLKNVISEKKSFGDYSHEDLTSPQYIASQEIATRFMHVDNYFRADNFSLSIGFIRPLYKPRELKRARTYSVGKQQMSK